MPLLQQEKATNVKNLSPQIIAALIKDTSTLNAKQLKELQGINNLEEISESLVSAITQDWQKTITTNSASIKKKIDSLDLTKGEKKSVCDMYDKTIVSALTKTIDDVKKQKKETEPRKKYGRLYTAILSESLVNILDGILSYQKELDEVFPKASDKIWVAVIPVIIASVSFLSPVVGTVLAASGLLNLAADFMKTENLSKTVARMKEDLDYMKKDSKLQKIQKELTKTSDMNPSSYRDKIRQKPASSRLQSNMR